jgi:general L-amino acid transport system permease protein
VAIAFQPIAARPAPIRTEGFVPWIRANLFANGMSTATTIVLIVLAVYLTPGFVKWAYVDAVFRPDADACQAARGVGACWGVVTEKWRLIVLGRFPFDEQWRPAIAGLLLVSLVLASCMRRFWNWGLVVLWLVVIPAFFVLMGGGWFGLSRVPTDNWGGLPLTIMLATFGIALAFPLSILVALGRRSQLPAIRTACIVYVELIRGVPLISVLFMASFLFPLFLPVGKSPDVLVRVIAGITLFSAAYLAETVRGGLQAIPKGQVEAAQSLGLSYWQTQRKIVLPQALAMVVPGDHEHLHRHLQGHVARHDREPLRAHGRRAARAQLGCQLAAVQDRGLHLHHAHLLRVLLRHVALRPVGREAGGGEHNSLAVALKLKHRDHRDHREKRI